MTGMFVGDGDVTTCGRCWRVELVAGGTMVVAW
jgi:hypothetical protein